MYKATLIGRLGRDPELKTLSSGATVCNLAVAETETWKDKNGERQERTTWIDCEAWGKTGEILNQYLSKGDRVYFEGRPGARAYVKDGEAKEVHTFRVERFEFINDKKDSGPSQPARNTQPAAATTTNGNDEDLPF